MLLFGCRLQEGGFNAPRRGRNNDKAHPPIHPTAHAGNLAGDDKKVYDFITRRFLAGCSKDAEGSETTVDIEYGTEQFYATGWLCSLEDNKRGQELYSPDRTDRTTAELLGCIPIREVECKRDTRLQRKRGI